MWGLNTGVVLLYVSVDGHALLYVPNISLDSYNIVENDGLPS
jgi:hypothetical protein